MDAKRVLDKVVAEERSFRKRDFLAPYTDNIKTALVKMGGMNYRFRIVGFSGSGIGIFEPVDHSCARYKSDADWETTRRYLDVLPHLHVILAFESDQGWIAYPMNMESTQKRFALEGEIIVKNVSDAERFDVITVRFDGMHFWYDDMFNGADMVKSNFLREAFDPVNLSPTAIWNKVDQIKAVTPEDKKAFTLALDAWNYFKRASTEEQIAEVLAAGGGILGTYVVRGANIEVKWHSKSGREYTSAVDKNFNILDGCAGICVDGEDHKFHLKDMPYIVAIGERDNAIYTTSIRDIEGSFDE